MARNVLERSDLEMALVGYEAEKARVAAAIAEIQAQLGQRGPGRPKAVSDERAPALRKRMSAAARKRIAAAQRKRWAASKQQKTNVNPELLLGQDVRKAIVEDLLREYAAQG